MGRAAAAPRTSRGELCLANYASKLDILFSVITWCKMKIKQLTFGTPYLNTTHTPAAGLCMEAFQVASALVNAAIKETLEYATKHFRVQTNDLILNNTAHGRGDDSIKLAGRLREEEEDKRFRKIYAELEEATIKIHELEACKIKMQKAGDYCVVIRGFPAETARPPEPIFGTTATPAAPPAPGRSEGAQRRPKHRPPLPSWLLAGSWADPFG